jgi:hypothetical protein
MTSSEGLDLPRVPGRHKAWRRQLMLGGRPTWSLVDPRSAERSNWSKHGGRLGWPQSTREPHAAASAIAASDHTRSGAEQRARTTAVAILAAAQNGTYACAREWQACSAPAGFGHAANWRSLGQVAAEPSG